MNTVRKRGSKLGNPPPTALSDMCNHLQTTHASTDNKRGGGKQEKTNIIDFNIN